MRSPLTKLMTEGTVEFENRLRVRDHDVDRSDPADLGMGVLTGVSITHVEKEKVLSY